MTLEHAIKRLEELKKKRHNLLDEISLKAMALAAKNITPKAYSDWLTAAHDRLWKIEQNELKTGSLVAQLAEAKMWRPEDETP